MSLWYMNGVKRFVQTFFTVTYSAWWCIQNVIVLIITLGPVSSKCLRQDFVLENVPGRFKDKSRVSSNSRNLGSSQILS